MARGQPIQVLRTSRAALNAQAGSGGLLAGEPYLITDEGRLAVGLTASTYSAQALEGHTHSALTDPVITGAIQEDVHTITDGAAFEIDPGNGSIQLLTLTASRTPKATNFAAGESVTLMVLDGSAYTLTWSDSTFGTSGVAWIGGSAPALSTTAFTVIELWKIGSQVYGALVGVV